MQTHHRRTRAIAIALSAKDYLRQRLAIALVTTTAIAALVLLASIPR